MVGALASNIDCGSDLTGVACGSSVQVVGAIISALFLATFLLTTTFLACTVYTRSPVSAVMLNIIFPCFSFNHIDDTECSLAELLFSFLGDLFCAIISGDVLI